MSLLFHSANLVKIKPKFDDEFTVVGFTEGKGKDTGAVIWVCEVAEEHRKDPNDYVFSVVPNMSYENRHKLFRCLSQKVDDPEHAGKKITRFERYVRGKPLTVAYAELSSKTGKPVQPKALQFRTYEGPEDDDPIKKLYEECQLDG
jgi:ATP-dependent DNA ligase